VPFDERKIRDPDKIEFIRIDESQLLAQADPQISEGIVYDFTLIGHEEDNVSGFDPQTLLQRPLYAFLQELGYRRLPAVRLNLDPGHALRTKYFNKINQIIQLFSRQVLTAGNAQCLDYPAPLNRLAKNPEFGFGNYVGYFSQRKTE